MVKFFDYTVCASCAAFAIIGALSVLAGDAASAAEPPLKAAVKGEVFHEAVSADVVVSGTVLVGLADEAPLAGRDVNALAITPGANRPAEVCLTVTTRDGVYIASNEFLIPSSVQPNQVVILPYDRSQYLARLSNYADKEISVRVTEGGCAEGVAKVYLVHRADRMSAKRVRLLINSFGATDVYLSDGDGSTIDCEPITEGRRTSYDFVCNTNWVPSPTGATAITIERERFGRPLPSVSVTVIHGEAR